MSSRASARDARDARSARVVGAKDAAAAEKEAVRQEETAKELEEAKAEDAEQAAEDAARLTRYACDNYTPCEAPEMAKFRCPDASLNPYRIFTRHHLDRSRRIEAEDKWGNRGYMVEVPNMWNFRSALEWGDSSGNGHAEW